MSCSGDICQLELSWHSTSRMISREKWYIGEKWYIRLIYSTSYHPVNWEIMLASSDNLNLSWHSISCNDKLKKWYIRLWKMIYPINISTTSYHLNLVTVPRAEKSCLGESEYPMMYPTFRNDELKKWYIRFKNDISD